MRHFFIVSVFSLLLQLTHGQTKVVVFQSDFGLKDGAVSEMKGVAMGVSPDLKLFDLTHEIPPYNIWEAAYRLRQTVPYWPPGTVFVSVVDPGVGTERKSVVLKTHTGQYVVTPDNGTLTLLAEIAGIDGIREIDEQVNRRKNSQESNTFHGRDVYAYTGARLAAGVINFEQVGPLLPKQEVVSIPYQKAVLEGKLIKGTIPVLDIQYGNVWTNIPADLFEQLKPSFGDQLHVKILHQGRPVYEDNIPYSATFGAVAMGKPLAYLNSLLQLSFALNQGSFAEAHKISSGNEWSAEVSIFSRAQAQSSFFDRDSLVSAGAAPKLISSQFKFTEGAAVDHKGNVFFTDQPNNRIWEYDLKGNLSLFMDSAGRSNGMYFDRNGNLVTCADEQDQLWSITPDKKITILMKDYKGMRLNGPNDLFIDGKGGIYFTDPYYQRDYWTRTKSELDGMKVYYLPKGKDQPVIVAADMVKPNGIVGTPDGKYIYVADIQGKKTYKYRINKDGSLTDRQLFVDMGADGITLDQRGNLYLAGDGITVFNPAGEKIAHIPVPAKWSANLCFGGKDKKTLFITASESIFTLPMRVKGVE